MHFLHAGFVMICMGLCAPVTAREILATNAPSVDCNALNASLVEHVRAGRYASGGEDNALQTIAALRQAGCVARLDEALVDEAVLGAQSTMRRLEQTGRHREHCEIMRFIVEANAKGEDESSLAQRAECEDIEAPVADWSEEDQAYVRKRVADRLAVRAVLHAAEQSAQNGAIYSPAGENAIEIALRGRELARSLDSQDVGMFDSALADLVPYAYIAAEQAAVRRERAEFDRLRALIARADPESSYLPHLQKIADTW
jgi:hypothetical protein